MRCPNCLHEVSDETGFCPACGSELPIEEPQGGEVAFSMPALIVDPLPPVKKAVGKVSSLDGLRMANTVWGVLMLVCAAVVAMYLVL